MKTFTKMAAQGDVLIERIETLPKGLKEVAPENGGYVVAHSETGHHHIIEARPTVRMYRLPEEIYEAFLVVEGDEAIDLQHKRSFDTHETLTISPGTYRVRRQREYVPEGYRRAAD